MKNPEIPLALACLADYRPTEQCSVMDIVEGWIGAFHTIVLQDLNAATNDVYACIVGTQEMDGLLPFDTDERIPGNIGKALMHKVHKSQVRQLIAHCREERKKQIEARNARDGQENVEGNQNEFEGTVALIRGRFCFVTIRGTHAPRDERRRKVCIRREAWNNVRFERGSAVKVRVNDWDPSSSEHPLGELLSS